MDKCSLPKITMVTPSYNQGRFLPQCIQSIIGQNYPNLEYFVMDGGSTDGSVDTIRRFSDQITYWRSHPDGGQLNALHEGFERSTGDIMGWLNSDDRLTPWAFDVVADVFGQFPEVDWITTRFPLILDSRGVMINCRRISGFHSKAFYRGMNAPLNPVFYSSCIQQESTFWRRSLWEKAGAKIDRSIRVVGDFELWSRFFQYAELCVVNVPLGAFRYHEGSGTVLVMDECMRVFQTILNRFSYGPPTAVEAWLRRYLRALPQRLIKWTGMAYPTKVIAHRANRPQWEIQTEWFA